MNDRCERDLLLPAPTSEVWEVVTGPDWLADEVALDLRPGGEASFCSQDGERSGWIEEVSPPEGANGPGRLTFWWSAPGESATRVELSLEPAGAERSHISIVETRPLEVLDVTGVPLNHPGGSIFGPSLIAA
jgi:uncharacterized protein YndB with AHSA1/START domain